MIKKYKVFESHINKRKDIRRILHLKGVDYTINDDFSVNIICKKYSHIDFRTDDIIGGQLPFKIKELTGELRCIGTNLSDLSNMPDIVKSYANSGGLILPSNNIKHIHNLSKNISGLIQLRNNLITDITVDEYNRISNYPGVSKLDRNPIQTLINYLKRRFGTDSDVDIIERLEEFEVIKDINKIDMLSFEKLFNFYNVDFKNVRSHLDAYINITENYDFINE